MPYGRMAVDNSYGLYGRYGDTASVVSQGLVEVRNQVFHVFDPDGKPHQAVREAHLALQLGRDAGVGHRRRMADEAFDTAQRLGEDEDLGALHHAPRPAYVAQLDAQHPAESRHLSAGEVVLWMRRQARV